MKILTIILLLAFDSYSQSNVSYVSPDKDTLILVNNELGDLISQTWSLYTYGDKKPKIIFASEQYITMRNLLKQEEENLIR